MHHVSIERRLAAPAPAAHDHADHDPSSGMAGMILGVTVLESKTTAVPAPAAPTPRRLTLTLGRSGESDNSPIGVSITGDRIVSHGNGPSSPGPTLVLKRDEPVEITVANRLGEATALHWHGMELESYYDGVHNWSGINRTLAPMIEAGGSFVVRFTPPRAGTFIYHTHLHDYRQLPLGLYGPMLVVDNDEAYQRDTDHAVVIGRTGIDPAAPDVIIPATPLVINGEASPLLTWKAGGLHRVRLINITPDSIVNVTLQTVSAPIAWTPVAKDGAPIPDGARTSVPARQTIAPGETYDFEVAVAPGRRTLWLEVRTTAGKWEAQAQIIAK
jgi:FtsP/CotA-like multicopper oxidase with cupredoxin domain